MPSQYPWWQARKTVEDNSRRTLRHRKHHRDRKPSDARPVLQHPADPQARRRPPRAASSPRNRARRPRVGAEVLAAGGDCVDAVIATTFALGVLEPWMSGLGGGGAMVLYRAREDRYEVIDYGMRAPASLRLEDYPLTGDGAASDIFPWPRVKDDRNIHGPGSIAVPGVVAGMEEAHRRHAKMPWKELLAPERRARRRRSCGRLVDHADDCEFGRRSAALSRERRRLSAGRPAAECAMGHQVQRAAAAGPAQGHDGASGGARPARFLRGRSGAQHRRRYAGRRRRAVGRRSRRLPRPCARAAGDSLSRRQGVCDAGTHRRADAGAYARACCRRVCSPRAARRMQPPTSPMPRRCKRPIASACKDMGDADGTARARRRSTGAGLHHAFLGGRPRRQHGGGDANPAVDLRLQIRLGRRPASP